MLLSPSDLILARCRAFVTGDFAFIYDCHHPDSFFRQLYPDKEGYLEYARTVLRHDFRIRECRILREETRAEDARVIYYLDTLYKSKRQEAFELCWLRRLDDCWRYLATQKIERQDFPGELEEISWEDFDKVEDKIVF